MKGKLEPCLDRIKIPHGPGVVRCVAGVPLRSDMSERKLNTHQIALQVLSFQTCPDRRAGILLDWFNHLSEYKVGMHQESSVFHECL